MKQNETDRDTTARSVIASVITKISLIAVMLPAFITTTHANGGDYNNERYVRTVTGTVTSASGEPLAGVSVQVPGSSTATTTDAKGAFSIVVNDDATVLRFTFVGML